MSNETIEYGINPSGVLERLTVSSRNPFDIDNSTIGDVSFGTSSGGGFSSFFDAFKDIDPTSALILLGIPAVVSALSGSGAVPTTPGTTTPGTTTPGDTGNQPGDTSKQPGEDELINAAKTAGISAATIDALLKYGLPALASYLSYKDAANAREEARGWSAPGGYAKQAVRSPGGGVTFKPAGKAAGGVASLAGGGIASLAGGGIASLAGGGNILDEEIKTYITNVLGNKKSQQEQAAEINAAAQKYNIGRDRIAQATGYGLDAVKQFLGPNIIGQKTAAAPYQVYDKASDTYRYVDAAGYEKWLSGIPLTPTNRVQGSPVYYGAPSKAEGYPDIGGGSLDYVPSMPDNDWLHEVSDKERDDLEAIASMRIPPLASVVDLSNVKTPEQFMFLLQNLDPNLFNEMLSSYNTIVKETQPFGPGSYRSVSKEGIASDRDAYRRNVTDEAAWAIYNDPDKTKDFVEALQNPELFLTKNQGPAADVFREAFPRWLQILGTANLSTPNGLESDYAAGGMTTRQPFYLGGITDGMADEVPAHIDNKRPAALSDGEFVIPADVVSHLGNGNSNAGAKRLYEMMDRIREARTGNSKQGIQVNPNNFMPG